MLTLDRITLRLGGHLILDRASAALPAKSRVGLVGRNGTGKSSLLKLIADIYEADDGSIDTPSGTRIGEGTPFETVLAAAGKRWRLLEEVEHATEPHRIGEIHETCLSLRELPADVLVASGGDRARCGRRR